MLPLCPQICPFQRRRAFRVFYSPGSQAALRRALRAPRGISGEDAGPGDSFTVRLSVWGEKVF